MSRWNAGCASSPSADRRRPGAVQHAFEGRQVGVHEQRAWTRSDQRPIQAATPLIFAPSTSTSRSVASARTPSDVTAAASGSSSSR